MILEHTDQRMFIMVILFILHLASTSPVLQDHLSELKLSELANVTINNTSTPQSDFTFTESELRQIPQLISVQMEQSNKNSGTSRSFYPHPEWDNTEAFAHQQQPIIMECKAPNPEHITWYKDVNLVEVDGTRISLTNINQTLTIHNPLVSDTGWYGCSLWNNGTITDNYSREITVNKRNQNTAPRVVGSEPSGNPAIKKVTLGDTVTIGCTFYEGMVSTFGLALEMLWMFNNTRLNDGAKYTYNFSSLVEKKESKLTLTIANITEKDLGDYQCNATNPFGGTSRNITLKLAEPVLDQGSGLSILEIIGISGGSFGFVLVVIVFVIAMLIRRKQKNEEMEWPVPDIDHYDVPTCELEYDVFISYSSEDEEWVKDKLFTNLQAEGYKVHIDFKDFTPGMAIADNVMDAVYKSRKTVIVMSKNFLKSMWGQFELQQAHNKAVAKRNDVLVLIKYGKCKVPGKLMGKTFLDWTDKSVKPHFWSRLYEFLGKPVNFRDSIESEEEKDRVNEINIKDAMKSDTYNRMTSDYDSMESSDEVFLTSGTNENKLSLMRQNMPPPSLSSGRSRISTESNSRISCDDDSQRLISCS